MIIIRFTACEFARQVIYNERILMNDGEGVEVGI